MRRENTYRVCWGGGVSVIREGLGRGEAVNVKIDRHVKIDTLLKYVAAVCG